MPAVIGEPDPAIRALLARYAREAGADPVRVVAAEYTITDIVVRGTGREGIPATGGTWFTLETPREHARLHTPLAGVHGP